MAVGRFVVFEGGECVGKTTQIKLLANNLRSQGVEVLITREPGGTPLGETIRTAFVNNVDTIDPLTQIYLMTAMRRHHVEKVILPALLNGTWVLSDRFVDSTRVYQGYVPFRTGYTDLNNFLIRKIDELYQDSAVRSLVNESDRTFIFDIPPEITMQRLQSRPSQNQTDFDKKPIEFHRFVRDIYRDVIASYYPNRIVIDANRSVDDVHASICGEIL